MKLTLCCAKQGIHIISLEPISRRTASNSFHELSMTSVSIDVIGDFAGQLKENCTELSESLSISFTPDFLL